MRLIPCDDKIVVEPVEADDRTPGGVFIPDVAKKRPQIGRVLAVGPGRLMTDGTGRVQRVPLDFKVGDQVLYVPHGGHEFTPNESDAPTVKILSAAEVLARVEYGKRREPALA